MACSINAAKSKSKAVAFSHLLHIRKDFEWCAALYPLDPWRVRCSWLEGGRHSRGPAGIWRADAGLQFGTVSSASLRFPSYEAACGEEFVYAETSQERYSAACLAQFLK